MCIRDRDYYVNKNGTVYTNVENASYDLFSQSDAAMGIRYDGRNADGFSNSAAHLANYLYSPYINSYDSDDISENGQNALPFEICVKMNDSALTVSYTHLDVYKRQSLY